MPEDPKVLHDLACGRAISLSTVFVPKLEQVEFSRNARVNVLCGLWLHRVVVAINHILHGVCHLFNFPLFGPSHKSVEVFASLVGKVHVLEHPRSTLERSSILLLGYIRLKAIPFLDGFLTGISDFACADLDLQVTDDDQGRLRLPSKLH